MTTYELPPEPPVGSRVRDARGFEWERHSDERKNWLPVGASGSSGYAWRVILGHGPLTLIEPDPWPTADLIVATREGEHLTAAHRIWGRIDDVRRLYRSTADNHEAHPGDTLTNVVPVTVVPTAEWESLVLGRGHHKAGSVRDDYLLRRVDRIITATDALGLDQ